MMSVQQSNQLTQQWLQAHNLKRLIICDGLRVTAPADNTVYDHSPRAVAFSSVRLQHKVRWDEGPLVCLLSFVIKEGN